MTILRRLYRFLKLLFRRIALSASPFILGVLLISVKPPSLAAQIPLIDTLTFQLDTAKSLNEKADILHRLASEVWDYDFERGLGYANESYQIAKRANYRKGMAVALNDIALYYYFKGDYGNAVRYFHRAIGTSAGDRENYVASIYIRLGNLHREQAQFDSATFYYNKGSILLDVNKPSIPLGQLYQNKGLLDYALARFTPAQDNFEKALTVRFVLGDSLAIGETWKTLGMVASSLAKFDTAEFYFRKIKRLAVHYNNPELLIFYNISQGELLFRKGDFVQSTRLFTVALDSLAKHDYKRYRALAMKNIGQVFEWQGDYQRALEFYFDALKIEEDLKSRLEIARTKQMMGWVYVHQKDYAKAIRLAYQAGRIFRDIKDDFGLSEYYTLSGYIAFHKNELDKAIQFYDSAMNIRVRIGTQIPLANTMNFIAEVYIAKGEYDKAISYEQRVFDIDRKVNNRVGVAAYYNSMSSISRALEDYDEAEDFAQLALREAEDIRSAPHMMKACQSLFTIYKLQGQFNKAVKYYERYIQLGDSLYTMQSAARQAELDALYRLEKREQEIEDLHQKTILQEAAISTQKATIRFQNSMGVFFIFGFILLASLAYLLYRYSRAKSQANEELSSLNAEIITQKKEIQGQSEELRKANETLKQLNHELLEKTEEIEAQSEELRESNDTIVAMNHDLDTIVTKRTAQLKEAYKELDTFFYRSSHDFRRPLTTFMGLAEVAKVTIKDQAALDLFEKVKETAKSLDKMLVKLQSISDVGAQELVYKEVLLKEIFSAICHGFEEELERKGFRTECDIQHRDPFISYPAMIRVILENMIENAIQFSAMEHPLLKLVAYQDGDNMVMIIEDNGQGIAQEYRARVFDMYFRASERSKGNGLGLYIVKKAVEKLNGTIRVETNVGTGSVFTITLPLQKN
jgi:signal transduction histidine kinase